MPAAASVPRVDLAWEREALGGDLESAIERVLASGAFILGPEVEAFEAEFADYCGTAHCIGTGSGTDAIRLALTACGVGAGDEVILPSHTAVPTAFAVEATGARPVFADVDPATYTLDPERAADAIGPATRALLPVALYGQCPDMEPLRGLAERHGLLLVEDACQAHGARYGARRAGSLGDVGCFSFYPTKNLGAYGDGGAVVTDDADLADRVRLLRNHGLTGEYVHATPTGNSRLDELQAALLRVKLPHLDDWNDARRRVAAEYTQRLRGVQVTLPAVAPWGEHVFHLYVVRAPHRDALLHRLREDGVEAAVHYPLPVHRQPPYSARWGDVALPHTERLATEIISLPMHPALSDAQLERVTAVVQEFAGLGAA